MATKSTKRTKSTHATPSSLTSELIVITGASAGIGAALARRLSDSGCRLILLARREEKLEPLANETGAAYYPVDLSDLEAVANVCTRILAEHGTPDILINNAGSGRFLSIEETSPKEAREQMALPYFAAFDMTRGLIEPMLARGSGTIFQINSPVAQIAWPGAVGYAAARYAVRGFTEALRQDLHGTGINVGSLTPTRVHSDYFKANPHSEKRVPKVELLVGTMTPDEVAEAAVHALEHRPNKDSNAPWRWALSAPIARAIPAPFLWLFRATGHKRSRGRIAGRVLGRGRRLPRK